MLEKLIDYWHRKRLARYNDKRNLADKVLQICTEGSVTGWSVKPREMEHIIYISRLLKIKDKNARALYDECISRWCLNASRREQSATPENIKFSDELQKEAQIASEKLEEVVSNWL